MRPETILRNLGGVWRLMLGPADGLKRLDLSSDGFWDSFMAIPLSAPALAIGWMAFAKESAALSGSAEGQFSLLLRIALVDLGTWVLPLVALALAARRAGIADRVVAYVVATNWGSVILCWLMAPGSLIWLLAPSAGNASQIVSQLLFLASLALTWRLTTLSIGKGTAIGSAVFVAMFVTSLIVLLTLQSLLGVSGLDQPATG